MGTLIGLLKSAEHNLSNTTNVNDISFLLGKAQVRQYNKLKELGAKDDEDVDELLERYPEAKLELLNL